MLESISLTLVFALFSGLTGHAQQNGKTPPMRQVTHIRYLLPDKINSFVPSAQKRSRRRTAAATGQVIELWYGTIAAPLVTGIGGSPTSDDSLRIYEDLIALGAKELGASLAPRPQGTSKTLPSDSAQRHLTAEKLRDGWDRQIRTAISDNASLLVPYVIGLQMGSTAGPFEVVEVEAGEGPLAGAALGKVGATIEDMRKLLRDPSLNTPKALDLEAEELQKRLLGRPKVDSKWFEIEDGLQKWFEKLLKHLDSLR